MYMFFCTYFCFDRYTRS